MARSRRKRSPWKRVWGELRYWLGWLGKHTLWVAILVGVLFILWQRDVFLYPRAVSDPSGSAAFQLWLSEDSAREQAYADFQAFLDDQGVSDVVPAWQLARVDEDYAQRCNMEIWRLPPRDLWPNIIPTLRLVRDHVVPAMGEVSVQSSYRSPELNECAGGASRSKHITFEAVDLWLVEPRDDLEGLYKDLCAMQASAGPDSRMGLGAYYDPSDEFYNPRGRFHIDSGGYRSWGRSYTSATSICLR